jgi:hypothetical protein
MNDMCEIKRCKGSTDIIYYGHEVCDKHWDAHCANKIDLKKILKVNTTGQLTLK